MKQYAIILIVIILLIYLTKTKMNLVEGFINPVNGRISSPFGELNKDLRAHSHNGVDIAIKVGTPIVAPANGKIKSVYEKGSGGKQLIIQHDNGFFTGYAHLSKNDFFKVGDIVKQGDKIALSGNTGHSTGAHLHFTMTNAKGVKVDPAKYFSFKA